MQGQEVRIEETLFPRLDFESMVLKGPEITDQKCTDDMLMIHGGFPVPNICGTNTNQHCKF